MKRANSQLASKTPFNAVLAWSRPKGTSYPGNQLIPKGFLSMLSLSLIPCVSQMRKIQGRLEALFSGIEK
jgi:hypothetical protein